MKNEEVLGCLYARHRRAEYKHVLVDRTTLVEEGWEGNFPTEMYTKFENYWVRYEKGLGLFKIVRIEKWMLEQKSEEVKDPNASLPITGKSKINLRDLYKSQIKESNKQKEN